MMFRLALLACLGVFAMDAARAAACPRPVQIHKPHANAEFENYRSLDLIATPGRPALVAFYATLDGTQDRALWMHRCHDQACSPGTTSKLDEFGYFDGQPQILLRANGRPLVVNNRLDRLHVFDCADNACRRGTNRPLHFVSGPRSVQAEMRSDGRMVVVYSDQYARSIDMLVCNDQDCIGWTHSVLRPFVSTVIYPEIQLELTSDDRPVLAVTEFDGGAGYTALVTCDTPACAAPVTTPVAPHYGYFMDLAMRGDDRALVFYSPSIGMPKLMLCGDPACSTSTTQTPNGYSAQGVSVGPDTCA